MLTMGATQHTQVVAGLALMCEMDFTQGTQRFTTFAKTVTVGGNTYQGLGTFAGVSGMSESADASADLVTLTLLAVDKAMLAGTLGNVPTYRGRDVRLYLQLFDAGLQPVGLPVLRWAGKMNRVVVNRHPAELGSDSQGTATIEMQCTRSGMARARHAQGLRLTDAQQQARHPGDTSLRYVRTLIAQPARWLSKAFQQV
jgi:hypothetical protein